MKIGVFDSGRGGEFIAANLSQLLPELEFMVVNDHDNVPYGSRSEHEIIELTDAAIQPLITAKCPIIVIACNTATMAAIHILRKRYPHIEFIGTEPMIKPAAMSSQNRIVTMLATPHTIASTRYQQLKHSHGNNVVIHEPDTTEWASHIEHGRVDAIDLEVVGKSVALGSDTIVLACTHYLALIDNLSRRFPSVTVLEPSEAIANHLQKLVSRRERRLDD